MRDKIINSFHATGLTSGMKCVNVMLNKTVNMSLNIVKIAKRNIKQTEPNLTKQKKNFLCMTLANFHVHGF